MRALILVAHTAVEAAIHIVPIIALIIWLFGVRYLDHRLSCILRRPAVAAQFGAVVAVAILVIICGRLLRHVGADGPFDVLQKIVVVER